MKEDSDGLPKVEDSARGLGVRPGTDVPASLPGDQVSSGEGGVSVSPDDPMNLPAHRRPSALQGTGKDPVWVIDIMDLDPNLIYRPDPRNPQGHGFLEPACPMPLVEYQQAVARTRDRWRKVV
jgi:hypothetical protein